MIELAKQAFKELTYKTIKEFKHFKQNKELKYSSQKITYIQRAKKYVTNKIVTTSLPKNPVYKMLNHIGSMIT